MMDTAQGKKNGKGKSNNKAGASASRAKPVNWLPAVSEFLLDWYIEKKLELSPKGTLKKMHHTASTTAVNLKYATTYTVEQVHRHYRRHKDIWALVARHVNESGGGWDDVNKMVTLSQSTLDELSVNDRGILTKPIQFYDKLQELFSGSSADGTFMQDATTADDSDHEDKEDNLDDMSAYCDSKDPELEDSDKLSSDSDDCKEVATLSVAGSQVSSSSAAALKVNKKNFKRTGKQKTLTLSHGDKANKSRSKGTQDDDDQDAAIGDALLGIKESLAKPIQVAAPPDPNAPLWDMLKSIALAPDDRMAVGLHLCKPEFKVHRSFLATMGKEYLERWVYKFLSGA